MVSVTTRAAILPHDEPLRGRPNPRLSSWQYYFQQLVKFHKKFGHIDVPEDYYDNPLLAKWIRCQRRMFRSCCPPEMLDGNDFMSFYLQQPVGIAKSRINQLNSIGFQWNVTSPKRPTEPPNPSNDKTSATTVLISTNTDEKSKLRISAKRISRPSREFIQASAVLTGPGTNADVPETPEASDAPSNEHALVSKQTHTTSQQNDRIIKSNMQYSTMDASVKAKKTLTSEPSKQKKMLSYQKNIKLFPEVLYRMISETSVSNPEIIEWLPCGKAFRVKDVGPSLGFVLQKYFNHDQYPSFQRQLNMYGFKKHIRGKYKGAFHHENFHRGVESSEVFRKTVVRQLRQEERNDVETEEPMEEEPMKEDHDDSELKTGDEQEEEHPAGERRSKRIKKLAQEQQQHVPTLKIQKPKPKSKPKAHKHSKLILKHVLLGNGSKDKISKGSTTQGKDVCFPEILHDLITESSNTSPHAISWVECGDEFVVNNPHALKPLLLKYFDHDNYLSFQRQLNNYGFKKHFRGSSRYAGSFQHPCFYRDIPCKSLLRSIQRKTQLVEYPSRNPSLSIGRTKKVASRHGKRPHIQPVEEIKNENEMGKDLYDHKSLSESSDSEESVVTRIRLTEENPQYHDEKDDMEYTDEKFPAFAVRAT